MACSARCAEATTSGTGTGTGTHTGTGTRPATRGAQPQIGTPASWAQAEPHRGGFDRGLSFVASGPCDFADPGRTSNFLTGRPHPRAAGSEEVIAPRAARTRVTPAVKRKTSPPTESIMENNEKSGSKLLAK